MPERSTLRHHTHTHTWGLFKMSIGGQPPHEGTGSKGLELNYIGKKWLNQVLRTIPAFPWNVAHWLGAAF